MQFLFILIFASGVSLAQHSEQPEKESTTDLRNQNIIFSIEETSSGRQFQLERTASLGNYLRMNKNGLEVVRKLDSRDAQKLDMDFASRFLKVQYEIPSVDGACQVTLRLNMKGEKQDLCQKDEKKTQEMMNLVNDLSKRF